MGEPIQLTNLEYGLVLRKLGQARRLMEKAKGSGLTLAEKLAMQAEAKRLRAEAESVGRK